MSSAPPLHMGITSPFGILYAIFAHSSFCYYFEVSNDQITSVHYTYKTCPETVRARKTNRVFLLTSARIIIILIMQFSQVTEVGFDVLQVCTKTQKLKYY